jgi:hypothetical protein
MAQFTYHFSSNGSLDDWNWEVQSQGKVIGRGVAQNHVKARVEAALAAMSYLDRSAKYN